MVDQPQDLLTSSQLQCLQSVAQTGLGTREALQHLQHNYADPSLVDDQLIHQHFHELSQRHGLHDKFPLLHDFIDRIARPIFRRVSATQLRCHPLLWPTSKKRDFLLTFTNCAIFNSDESTSGASNNCSMSGPSEAVFLDAFEKYAPTYVFEGTGWIQNMSPALLEQVCLYKLNFLTNM